MSLTASPPIGLSALAFPAMATMSCATLPTLPQHCTQVEGKKQEEQCDARHTHTHLAATNKQRNEQKWGLFISAVD